MESTGKLSQSLNCLFFHLTLLHSFYTHWLYVCAEGIPGRMVSRCLQITCPSVVGLRIHKNCSKGARGFPLPVKRLAMCACTLEARPTANNWLTSGSASSSEKNCFYWVLLKNWVQHGFICGPIWLSPSQQGINTNQERGVICVWILMYRNIQWSIVSVDILLVQLFR